MLLFINQPEKKMLRNILIGLLCFFCWNSCFAQQPTGDLSTPQEVANQHIYYLTEEYDVDKSAAALVGEPKKVTEETRNLAIKLKQIFDGKGLMVRADLIPDNPDYIDSTSKNAVYVLFPNELPEIYITRPLIGKDKRDRKYANYWRFDPASIKLIPELHRSVYPLGIHYLLELLPQGGSSFLGLKAWQYLAIFVLGIISFLLNFIIWRLLNMLFKLLANTKLGQNHFDSDIIIKISRVISYLVVAYVIFIFFPVLMLPVWISYYFLAFLRVFNTVCAVLVVLNAVELARSYFEAIVSKTESTSDDQLLPIFIRILKVIVVIVGAIYVLDVFNVDLTALIAGLSIGGLAIALAAQDTVKHLIGSIMIYADRPFQLGDFISSGEITGTVEDIGFRSTRIRTPDSSLISVPNGSLVDMVVNNMGSLKYRRFNTTIGVAYYTPPALIEKFVEGLRAINEAHPLTKSETSFIHLNNMGGSSLDILFIIYFNTTEYASNLILKEEIIFSILNLAEALNVHIAFPSTSVYIESMPEKKGQMPDYNSGELSEVDQKMQEFLTDFRAKYPNAGA
ncbi:MAG: MscS family membrane protein [Aureispira sp.]